MSHHILISQLIIFLKIKMINKDKFHIVLKVIVG